MHPHKAVDIGCINLIRIKELPITPFGIVSTTDVDTQTESGEWRVKGGEFFYLLHFLSDRSSILLIQREEVANLLAIFQEKVVVAHEPTADHDVPMFQHFTLQSLTVTITTFETRRRKNLEGCKIFCHKIPSEASEIGVAYLKILVFITEAHRNDFTTMLPSPCVDMGILQQVVTHLGLISSKYHRAELVISKYFLRTSREMSSSRFLS